MHYPNSWRFYLQFSRCYFLSEQPTLLHGWKGTDLNFSVHLAVQTDSNTACTTAQHIYLVCILYSHLLFTKPYVLHTISKLKIRKNTRVKEIGMQY